LNSKGFFRESQTRKGIAPAFTIILNLRIGRPVEAALAVFAARANAPAVETA
jgi:hypothetical protein